MKKKITAKILSLLLLGTMLISCDQAVDSDNNSNETKIEVVEENGIVVNVETSYFEWKMKVEY